MEIEDLFKKWEKYLTGKADYHHGQLLAIHSIIVNIQRMIAIHLQFFSYL